METTEKRVKHLLTRLTATDRELELQTTDNGIYRLHSQKELTPILTEYYKKHNGDVRKILTDYRVNDLPQHLELEVGIHTEADIERIKRLKVVTKSVIDLYKVHNYALGFTSHAIRDSQFPLLHLQGKHYRYIYGHSLLVVYTPNRIVGRVVRENNTSTVLPPSLSLLQHVETTIMKQGGDRTEVLVVEEILSKALDLRKTVK